MKPYYELHVTYTGDPMPTVVGWSQSTIDGDIILGEGPKRYLTHHAKGTADRDLLVADMEAIARIMRAMGRKVLRTKVELVVYDQRTP